MANHQNLKSWKKGQSGNPGGGNKKLSEDRKRIRRLTNDELKEMGDLVVLGTIDDLRQIFQDPKATIIRKWIARVCAVGMQKGDMGSLNELLNRLVGKVSDKIQIECGPIPLAIFLTKDGTAKDQLGNQVNPADIQFSPSVPPLVIEKQSGEKEILGVIATGIQK